MISTRRRTLPIPVMKMTTSSLRQLVSPEHESAARSVEDLQALIGRLAVERQQLRESKAGHDVLERNRVDLLEAQRELSHALIARYVPHAA
jgi:hypothetical protein